MKLAFVQIDKLCVSKLNMRHARKAPDVSDILPTVRARGILQPIIVRPCGSADGETGHHEILAGARRFHAARIIDQESAEQAGHEPAQLPCAILEEGDDAAAIEASLIENSARLDPDEVSRWECFIRLIKEGRRPADIAATFGLPDLAVKRILALGNLLPRIRDLYRREEIDAGTVRHLTLASKTQQKAWLALLDDADAYAPRGFNLKGWLFGGQSIPAKHALFDVSASGLATVADLFGEDSYFADGAAFWAAQNAAIEARRAEYLEAGWADVITVGPDDHFQSWEHEKTSKRKGGRVYLDVRANGEVIVHEGYLSRKEAARLAKAGSAEGEDSAGAKTVRPELTANMQTYVHLHRHAAVRAEMVSFPGVALRLMAAHAIAGSHLWRVMPEPQATRSDAIADSIENCAAETVFDRARVETLEMLGLSAEEPHVTGSSGGSNAMCALFARLLLLPDSAVLAVIAVVMGETLAAGSPVIETLAAEMGVDMQHWWKADDAFFEPLRDREVLLAVLAEVGGSEVAAASKDEKAKTLKTIIRDHLDGVNGRERSEHWVPRWMAFPPSAYTPRGGVETVDAHRHSLIDADEREADPCEDGLEPDEELGNDNALASLGQSMVDAEGGEDHLAA
jgi:ParB family chromosome partitioning protein